MAKKTLYNKLWEKHKVCTLPTGQDQLFIGLHLIHEVTTPQAFAAMKERGGQMAFPNRTFATVDHIIPTQQQLHRPYRDAQSELMSATLEHNVKEYGVPFFSPKTGKQGIVHVIGPELGLTQPGMTIACGDSHTSTHGAFGSLGFGIGTSEVSLVLETQTLALSPLNVRKIQFDGVLQPGVTPKDVVLKIIQVCGVKGGLGYAYEYAGDVFDDMDMNGRMTVCNMAIEGGARIGYVNPDQTTYDYIKGREYAPKGTAFEERRHYWESIKSDPDASYDDIVHFDGNQLAPMVTWGITPGQSVSIDEKIPDPSQFDGSDQQLAADALTHMKLSPGLSLKDINIDVVFLGSCTNSRLSDLEAAAKLLDGKKICSNLKMIVVPGSQQVKKQAEKLELDKIFTSAGAEWRDAGCSMCLGMNPDKLVGDQRCASTSNRNFIGRQGSADGKTFLMSPQMAAVTALNGKISDVRDYL